MKDHEDNKSESHHCSQPLSHASATGAPSHEIDSEIPPPALLASQGSFGSYSSSQEAIDRASREEKEFNVYTKYSDEKPKIAKIIDASIFALIPVRHITIVDFGCGNGSLLKHYLAPLLRENYTISYYGIENKDAYIHATINILKEGGVTDYNILNGDCFSEEIYQHLPKNPDFILVSHIGYFGDADKLINNIKNYMNPSTLALFIHQAKTSSVTQLREKFSSKVETDIPLLVGSVFARSNIKELLIPSSSSFEANYANFSIEFFKKRYPEHRKEGVSQEMASETEFLLQKNKESLRKEGQSEECAKILRNLITTDNKIITWNHLQACCHNQELIDRIEPVFAQFAHGKNDEMPYIFDAIKEGNLGALEMLINQHGEEVLASDFLGIGVVTALVVASTKFLPDNETALQRYKVIAKKLMQSSKFNPVDLTNAMVFCAVFNNLALGEVLREGHCARTMPEFALISYTTLPEEELLKKLQVLRQNFPDLFHEHSPYVRSLLGHAKSQEFEATEKWLTENIISPETRKTLWSSPLKRERSCSPSR